MMRRDDKVLGGSGPAPRRTGERGAVPTSPVAAELLRLQRSTGNRAVGRALGRQAVADVHPQACGSDAETVKGEIIRRLDEWKREAEVGVENFADAELVQAIKEATAFNPVSFLGALVGNVIWAAACFTPAAEALPVFALSLAGISIGAGTAIPPPLKKDKGPLMTTKEGMLRQLDQLYREFKKQATDKSKLVFRENPKITVDDALERVLRASFGAEFLLPDDETHRYTDLDDEAIRTKYQEQAADLLEKYKTQVQTLDVTAMYYLCWINPGGLAVVERSTEGPIFLHWVGHEMAGAALAEAKSLGQTTPLPTYNLTDVLGVPLGSAATRSVTPGAIVDPGATAPAG